MKSFKTQVGDLNVVVKYMVKKDSLDDNVTMRVYLKDSHNYTRNTLGEDYMCELLGLDKDRDSSLVYGNVADKWRVDFFVDGLANNDGDYGYDGEDAHLFGYSNLYEYNTWHKKIFWCGNYFCINGLFPHVDYLEFNINKDIIMNHSISLRLVSNEAKMNNKNCSDEDAAKATTKSITLFTIPAMKETQIEKAHKANRLGYMPGLFEFFSTFMGIFDYIPAVSTDEECEKWYNTLTQEEADHYRNFVTSFYHYESNCTKPATEKQINLIKSFEGGEDALNKLVARNAKLDVPTASLLIDYFKSSK